MNTPKTRDINQLVGTFMDFYEQWEENPPGFHWQDLQALAQEGAHSYNEGYGPSFQVLTFDGYPYGELHERFLNYLLEAGFDPFHTVEAASGTSHIPVFGHDGLAFAARSNPVAARMQEVLFGVARRRFGGEHPDVGAAALQRIVFLCHDSIPNDVLSRIAPDFVSSAPL